MGKPDSTNRPPNPAHDVSAWKQVVVGTQEFAPASRRGILWVVLGLVLVGGGLAVYFGR